MQIHIRAATHSDCKRIAEFNQRLAAETEDKTLDRATVEAGVSALLANSALGRYFIAEADGAIVGQLMHTREWSDWRNGEIWWLQSVYVDAGFRRNGVFRQLFDHLVVEARKNGAIGIRLYVEKDNSTAQETYRRLGLEEPGYIVMERFTDLA